MGNFATAHIAALTFVLAAGTAAHAADALPTSLGYTYFVRGQRVGRSDVRIVKTADALRFESKVRVNDGDATFELNTRTEADPRTYALRTFSYEGTKGGKPVSSSVTVQGDSAFGSVAMGGAKQPRRSRVTPGPMVVWEDWVMDLEILLALQEAREFDNTSKRGLLLAGSYASAMVTLGYTGEVVVESAEKSMTARKLVVAIQGGGPFESLIDPKRGVPIYIHFPGIQAEVFLDDFFGDNPVPKYSPAANTSNRR